MGEWGGTAARQQAPAIHHGGGEAYYLPSADAVHMPPREAFNSPAAYYATLFHELTHATGHTSRLNRKGVTDAVMFGSHEYSREELIAEMGSAFVAGHCGIEAATLSADARTISLRILGLGPTQCMEVVYDLKGSGDEPVRGRLHNTIHLVGD